MVVLPARPARPLGAGPGRRNGPARPHRRRHRGADPGPDRSRARAQDAAGAGHRLVYVGFCRLVAAIGVLLFNPVTSQITTLAAQPAVDRRRRQSPAGQPPDLAEPPWDQRSDQAAGADCAGHAAEVRHQALRRRSSASPATCSPASSRSASTSCSSWCCRSICCSTARTSASSPAGSCRPETARRRMTTRCSSSSAVSGYVRGQLLFSLVMGASAAAALTIFGLLGIFPAGETLRGLLRRLLRADGVHPVHRSDHRTHPGDPGGAVPEPHQRRLADPRCSSPSSSWRATWWRRRCSASRCGSTRS